MHDLIAITGAGISKASGIPTFEEMVDLRSRLSRDYFNAHPGEFYDGLLKMKETIDRARPNPAHLALAEHGIPVVTMNIDGLHSKAGSRLVLEVHGNLEQVICRKCDERFDFYVIRDSIYCSRCGELLQPDVVLYGDMIRYYADAIDLIGSSREVLVVGTSFYTSTVNEFVYRARLAGKKISIINQSAETEVAKFLERF
ncbi:MAG TPA: Sir2 family NAD-dependent protein deacetylase [Candidatus Atribacteria bacterium]|nr:Sir2 family NAD-dependent protein deacetylase [Candidatus Atribacteria bacterium]